MTICGKQIVINGWLKTVVTVISIISAIAIFSVKMNDANEACIRSINNEYEINELRIKVATLEQMIASNREILLRVEENTKLLINDKINKK